MWDVYAEQSDHERALRAVYASFLLNGAGTAAMLSRVEVLRTLPPQAFWPAPKVESALVRMTRDDRLRDHAGRFSDFVRQLFSFRRKTLRRGLTQMSLNADGLLAKLSLDPQARPETVAPEKLYELFDVARR
jgi:16S rRNA (adenine1518-N6/adenine1519-N6)-dimethyltransferase